MVTDAAERRRRRQKSHAAAAGDNRPARRRRRRSEGQTPPPKRITSARITSGNRPKGKSQIRHSELSHGQSCRYHMFQMFFGTERGRSFWTDAVG